MDVLIADDDRHLCEALYDVLTSVGYEVDCAQDATEACRRLDRGSFALVITDWAMPGSGGAVVSHARSSPGLPVIVLSSDPPSDLCRPDDAQSVTLLAKPVDAQTLLKTVRDLIGPAPERRKHASG